ncbi:MAG: hypothetical protein M3544_06020 [Pseudomonadota bacterium]|nr:hypothetical protein [Pseudomonadota bacterium]
MIPPDHEIFEVEQRIAARRSQVRQEAAAAGRRAMQKLSSPAALIGAAALGFLVAGGLGRRDREPPHPERRKSDHTKAAKATGLAGVLMTGAMWLIKAKYGSPVHLAQVMLEKLQKRNAPAVQKPPRVKQQAARY